MKVHNLNIRGEPINLSEITLSVKLSERILTILRRD